jgi:hypothetical protein
MGSQQRSKQPFLVVYDYGSGGLWAYIRARSRDEIAAKYPSLKIVDQAPWSITDADLNLIGTKNSWDIDEPPTDWLLALLKEGG